MRRKRTAHQATNKARDLVRQKNPEKKFNETYETRTDARRSLLLGLAQGGHGDADRLELPGYRGKLVLVDQFIIASLQQQGPV